MRLDRENMMKERCEMNKELIYIGSVTQAMKGRDLLKKHGIAAHIERSAVDLDTGGCGYSIMVVDENRAKAELILKRHHIIKGNGSKAGKP